VEIRTETRKSLENLSYLPSFAQYILQHCLHDFIKVQMQISEEVGLPMMSFFSEMPYEQRFEITKAVAAEMLTELAQNKARQYIEMSSKKWQDNMLPVVRKEDITAEDITMINYLRKKSLMHFLAAYCTDSDQLIELVKEIDLFLLHSETTYTNVYINVLKESLSSTIAQEENITKQLQENEYLYKRAEAITHLGSYKWDLRTNELIWSDELYRIYGLEPGKDEISFDYISSFNYPEDIPHIRNGYSVAIKEKKPFDFHYRIRPKNQKDNINGPDGGGRRDPHRIDHGDHRRVPLLA